MIFKIIILARNLRQNHHTLPGYTCVEEKNSHYSLSYFFLPFLAQNLHFWRVVFARLKKGLDFFDFLSLIFSRFPRPMRRCGEVFRKIEGHLHIKIRPKLLGRDASFGQNTAIFVDTLCNICGRGSKLCCSFTALWTKICVSSATLKVSHFQAFQYFFKL